MGYIHDELSPSVTLSAIGELSINEWNNLRKPQIMLQDIKVDEWQLFDFRGTRNVDKLVSSVTTLEESIIVTFEETTHDYVKNLGFEQKAMLVKQNKMP